MKAKLDNYVYRADLILKRHANRNNIGKGTRYIHQTIVLQGFGYTATVQCLPAF